MPTGVPPKPPRPKTSPGRPATPSVQRSRSSTLGKPSLRSTIRTKLPQPESPEVREPRTAADPPPEEETHSGQGERSSISPDGPRRILVAEDDSILRNLVCSILRREGYEVEIARDGVEALERVEAADFDLILLDLMMPRLSGFGVVEALADGSPEALSRIVIMTATTQKEYASLQVHPLRGVVQKPFDIEQFSAYVARCVSEVRAESRSVKVP